MKRNATSPRGPGRPIGSANGSASKRRKVVDDADSDDDRASKVSSGSARRSLRSGKELPDTDAAAGSPAPSVSPDTKPASSTATLPAWLTTGVAHLQQKYPTDSFHGTFNALGEPRVSCSDCPGTLYLVGPTDVSNFEPHLRNKRHRENVASRLGVRLPTKTPPATFKEQLRYEANRSSPLSISTSLLGNGGRSGNGSGSGSGDAIVPADRERTITPILPVKGAVPETAKYSPTVRIAALEKANAEKDAKIEELERRLSSLEGEVKKQGKGKGKSSSQVIGDEGESTPSDSQESVIAEPATARKGLTSIFQFWGSPAAQ